MIPLWYFVVGVIIAIIVLLVALGHSNEEDRRLKAKQLGLWALLFVGCTLGWPLILVICWMAAM